MAPVSRIVGDCVCLMNVRGIVLQPTGDITIAGADCGSDNLVENCVCYGNSPASISRYVANNDVIRNGMNPRMSEPYGAWGTHWTFALAIGHSPRSR